MKTAPTLKIIAITLAVIAVILVGILIFVPAVKSPTVSTVPSASSTVSADGNLTVVLPHPNDIISSPAAIEGAVTGGGWFFEASFPIKILDGTGATIGQGTAQALSDWMSTGTVPFSASIPFTAPKYASGTIVFMSDNPSGNPANQKLLSVPVVFSKGMSNKETVTGRVVLGPTCPVEQNPPNPQCAPRPYQTTIDISKNLETFMTIATIQADASGTFSVLLMPGEYDFKPTGGSPFPRCSEQLVTVVAGETNDVTINCDTGIR